MKNSTKAKLTALLFTFGATSMAPTVMAGQGHGCERGGHKVPMMRLMRKLDLSDDQRQQAKDLVKAYKQSIKNNKVPTAERQANYAKMQELIKAPNFDDQSVEDFVSQNSSKRQASAVARIKLQHDLYQLLTPEQQTKAEELKASFRKRHN